MSCLRWIHLPALLGLLILATNTIADPRQAVWIDIDGAIGPATSDYVATALADAADKNAALVVLRMDTPGGLDTAMRAIIRDILASPVPVAAYVAPSGARAASAGTYILYASHVAAMAPATNLGAATPVQIGSPGGGEPKKGEGSAMEHKIVNDAVAYIRGLAELRGRNAQWAEKAVREGASLSATEALKMNVVDLIAPDMQTLLRDLNGRKVNVLGREVVLNTTGVTLVHVAPDWRTKLLAVLTDPNVAYILMLIGIYGLVFEFASPGAVVPGVVGGISLLLALFAFQVVPINYAGLGLILLGVALMVAEAMVPSFGALGVGGVAAFVIGSIILMKTDVPGYGVSLPLVGAVALLSAALFLAILVAAVKARRRPVVSGQEELIGAVAEVLEDFDGAGKIRIHSETWDARTTVPVHRGQRVRVTKRDGLVLWVEPVDSRH